MLVLRRPRQRAAPEPAASAPPALPWPALVVSGPPPEYEYQILVTNLTEELLSVSGLYAQRADAENVYDELKNQWGWGEFKTQDLLRCQVAARNVALVYNWWNLFVRCAEPERPRAAVTSTHAEAARAQELWSGLSLFLSGLLNTAEQWDAAARWDRIWDRILRPWLRARGLLPGPSG